jgi:glycosyltransferase involved in cell wall biosynthesis
MLLRRVDSFGGCLVGEHPSSKIRSNVSNHRFIHDASPSESMVDASVVLLTHYLPLYQVRVFQEIAKRVRQFKVLLSTPIEPNRQFEIDWGGLDVSVQKSVMFRRRWRHDTGFQDEHFVHFPYDTLAVLRRVRPDVVMSHELGARSLVAGLHRVLGRRNRLILMTYMSEHTELGRGSLRKLARKRLLGCADAVTYNGPSCKQYVRQLGVAEDRLFHLPYAADDRTFGACDPARDESAVRERLICVGQLSERKGVLPMLLQLAAYCQQRPARNIHLTLVGQGPLRDSLLEVSLPQNLRLEIIPQLAPAELSAMYRNYGAAIHPTLADEWLMVVNESMHTGLVMIGSCYAQAVETIVRDGENGWSFDPLKTGDLAEKLDAYFLASNDAIAKMREVAMNSVADRTPEFAASGAVSAIRSVI